MIKFRAKVKMPEKRNFARQEYVPEGQWVYGEPHTIDCPTPHIHTVDVGKQPIDEETICQFTGLKDRNGKEIYEGDIMLFHGREYFAVWDEEEARFVFKNKTNNRLTPYKSTSEECFEIIGNIHDNPELMEGGEKCSQS